MSLFDAFSGKAGRKASMWGQQNLNQAMGQAGTAIDAGRTDATNWLLGPGGTAETALRMGYEGARDTLTDYSGQAQGYLDQGAASYDGMVGAGNKGLEQYLNLVGLGPQGAGGMQSTLEATPGYQFTRDQGLDGVMRNASARGMLASGNTSADLLKMGSGLASQTYQSALGNLNPLLSMFSGGTQGRAANYGQKASLADSTGRALAGNVSGWQGNMAKLFGGVSDMNYQGGMQKGSLAKEFGQATTQVGMSGMMAGQQASQNALNTAMGVAGMFSDLAKSFAKPGGK